jgi:hypothetical protein
MKTQSKKDINENEDLISHFAEIIRTHCTGEHDAWYLVKSIRECMEFMFDRRFDQDPDILCIANSIRKTLVEKNQGVYVDRFEKMAEISSQVLILASQNYEGIDLIYNMSDDLSDILS